MSHNERSPINSMHRTLHICTVRKSKGKCRHTFTVAATRRCSLGTVASQFCPLLKYSYKTSVSATNRSTQKITILFVDCFSNGVFSLEHRCHIIPGFTCRDRIKPRETLAVFRPGLEPRKSPEYENIALPLDHYFIPYEPYIWTVSPKRRIV